MCIKRGTRTRVVLKEIPKSKMKKHVLYFLLFVFMCDKKMAQIFEKEDKTVTPYYGPKLFDDTFYKYRAITPTGVSYSEKISSIGTFGVSGEYLISHVVSFGEDIFYNSSETTRTETFGKYGPLTYVSYNVTYDYKITTRSIGAYAHMNIDINRGFGSFVDEFDTYLILALGYHGSTYLVATKDPEHKFIAPKGILFNSSNPLG